jgi:hypothetical protein
MKKLPLFSLPYPSTAAIREPTLTIQEGGVQLSLVCDDDGCERSFNLFFIKSRAFRKREETYCTEWHIEGAYDTVCEIEESDWITELRSDAIPEWRDRWTMRHFMIYIDSFGCLEVIAESASLN